MWFFFVTSLLTIIIINYNIFEILSINLVWLFRRLFNLLRFFITNTNSHSLKARSYKKNCNITSIWLKWAKEKYIKVAASTWEFSLTLFRRCALFWNFSWVRNFLSMFVSHSLNILLWYVYSLVIYF